MSYVTLSTELFILTLLICAPHPLYNLPFHWIWVTLFLCSMVFGWFQAFRENGAPTWYGDNRTPVVLDFQIAGLFSIFVIPSIAFLIILPGVKRTKLSSSLVFLSCMLTGATLLVGLRYPCWQIAHVRIHSHFKAFTTEKMEAVLGVKIGLETVNITLETIRLENSENKRFTNLNVNERFSFSEVHQMEKELTRALTKGLPFPILKVIEYLSVERGGFIWGREYRMAGYYTMCCHIVAIISWFLALIFLHLLPELYAVTTIVTGIFTLLGNVTYWWIAPQRLSIRFQSIDGWSTLKFTWGHCFWASLVTGILCVFGGCVLYAVQQRNIYRLVTVFSSRLYNPTLMMDPLYHKSAICINSFENQHFRGEKESGRP